MKESLDITGKDSAPTFPDFNGNVDLFVAYFAEMDADDEDSWLDEYSTETLLGLFSQGNQLVRELGPNTLSEEIQAAQAVSNYMRLMYVLICRKVNDVDFLFDSGIIAGLGTTLASLDDLAKSPNLSKTKGVIQNSFSDLLLLILDPYIEREEARIKEADKYAPSCRYWSVEQADDVEKKLREELPTFPESFFQYLKKRAPGISDYEY